MRINGNEYEIMPDADLTLADLRYANLKNADLTNANLIGAKSRRTELEGEHPCLSSFSL
jgi:uncharacterized protein YjbI with pentapeptide repeats